MNKKLPRLFIARHLLAALIFLFVSAQSLAESKETIEILTDSWSPYINPNGEALGAAAKIIDILSEEIQVDIKWRYIPYGVAYQRLKGDKASLGFPYYRTKKREKEVTFSQPLFSVTSRIFYCRQFFSEEKVKDGLDGLRFGNVAGYSYGEKLDAKIKNAKSFPSEHAALVALFNNEIDLLPMTEGVMRATLRRYFANREQLVRAVPALSDQSSLHMIAPGTKEGEAMISRMDNAINRIKALGISNLQPPSSVETARVDLAQLVSAEGYPAILGQKTKEKKSVQYFTLPQGTRVIVLEWSKKILEPSNTDRLYKNMMDLSRVVVLNGPHVGKELFVRNMHIQLL